MSVTIPKQGFLRLPQVLAIIPISKSSWWEGCRIERFPKPVKIGPRITVWRAEDIMDLVQTLGQRNAPQTDKSSQETSCAG